MMYDFINEYFDNIDETQFASAHEQWFFWEEFVDMLCMISLVRREQFPDTSQELIGAALEDKELVAALEPRKYERFSEWERVRKIYFTLLKKGEITDLSDGLLPLWQFTNAGMMTHIEIMAFIMAALVDRNQKYAKIFNRFMGESGPGYPSAGLVHDLCCLFLDENECDVAILYDESSILNRVFTEKVSTEGRISKHFCLEQLVTKRLSGTVPSQLGSMASFACIIEASVEDYADECFIHEKELDRLLMTYASAIESDGMSYVFELIGNKGAGKKHLLSQFAGVSGCDILCIDMEKLLDETEATIFAALKKIVVMAMCEMKLIYLYHISGEGSAVAKERFCVSFLQAYLRQLFIGCRKDMEDELSYKGTTYRINVVSSMSSEQKKGLWKDFANRLLLDVDDYVDELVLKYSLCPGDMWKVLCSASMEAEFAGDDDILVVSKELVEKHIRDKSRVDFGTSVTRLESNFRLADIKLPEVAKVQFEEALTRALNRNVVNETFGFENKLPYGKGLCVLLYGPPGTGKTMAAGVFGNELGLDVYRVDLSQINSKYIGDTEKNLENIFRVAKGANIILFFDEADALFAKRTEVSDSKDKFANSQTAYLLQKIEEYDGICILATNGAQNFDAAFKRRMTYMIPIEKPDREVRLKLWENVFPKDAPLSGDVDYEALSGIDELSGAQIKSAALSAAYMAAASKREICQNDIILGIEREYKKDGRLDFESKYNSLVF